MTGYPDRRYFALHPGLRLRNDIDRAVLITRPQPLTSRSYICRLLPPAEAVVLSLMNGRRTGGDIVGVWAAVTQKPTAQAEAEVHGLIEFYTTGERGAEEILLTSDREISGVVEYDPLAFVLPSSRVNTSDRRLRIPANVHFLTSLYCPQNCIYCYAKIRKTREKDLLSLGRIREILQELASLGNEAIQFSGGDALARPGIFEIIEDIYRLGMVADIPTKIGLGADKAHRLKAIGVEVVQFSLDCVDPDMLDFMVGLDDYHQKAFRALQNLKDAGLRVRINTVLTPYNADKAAALIAYVGDLGNVVHLSLSPYGRSLFRHRDELFVDESHLVKVAAIVSELAPQYSHMRITVGGVGVPPPADARKRHLEWTQRAFCTGNRDSFVILPNGLVTACEELYDHQSFIMGDLRRQSVMEMWNSREARALIYPDQLAVPGGACATCDDFEQCNAVRGRCWRDVLKSYGWDKPYYPDPRCPKAPVGNRIG